MVKKTAYQIDKHSDVEIKKTVKENRGTDENAKTYEIFASRLNKELTERKINQEEFAKKIDISVGSLSNYRNGKNIPTGDIIVKIANEFNCSTDYLLGLTDLKSMDSDFKAIHEITGLSDKAIKYLEYELIICKKKYKEYEARVEEAKAEYKRSGKKIKYMIYNGSIFDTLNYLIENESNYHFLYTLTNFLWENNNTNRHIENIISKNKRKDLSPITAQTIQRYKQQAHNNQEIIKIMLDKILFKMGDNYSSNK